MKIAAFKILKIAADWASSYKPGAGTALENYYIYNHNARQMLTASP